MVAPDSASLAERTLVTTKIFDAPVSLVFQAWTDPGQLARWFPPEGFTAPRCEVDPRPGGVFRVDMQAPGGPPMDGKVFPGPGLVEEIVPNERLVFTMTPDLGDGRRMPTVRTTVRFEAQGGRTRVTVEETLPTVAEYETMVTTGMAEGIRQSLDKLAGVLSGNSTDRGASVSGRVLTLVRVFPAPRELVWTAYTDPRHITRWMFANDWESPFAETDLRSGGAFRFGMRSADHTNDGFVFDGTYREIVEPERIVQVIGDGRVMTTTFEEVLGGTRLTLALEMAMGEEQERAGYGQILDHLAAHLAATSGAVESAH